MGADRAAQTRSDGDQDFELEIARSGQIVPVRAAQTALQALTLAAITVPMAREEAVGGTCLTHSTGSARSASDEATPPPTDGAVERSRACTGKPHKY